MRVFWRAQATTWFLHPGEDVRGGQRPRRPYHFQLGHHLNSLRGSGGRQPVRLLLHPQSPLLHLPSTRPRPRGGGPFPGPSPVLRPDAQQVAPPVGPGSPGRALRLLRPLDAARSPPVEASEGPAGRSHGDSRAAAAPAPAAAARPVSHRRHL